MPEINDSTTIEIPIQEFGCHHWWRDRGGVRVYRGD